jgi:uncharacterized protein (TIGR01655 family)
MTKKPVFWIILVVVAALAVLVALWGKQYYEDRYVGSDYYAMVPLDYDMAPETLYSMKGEEAGQGKRYKLTAYDEQGGAKSVSFNIQGGDSAQYLQPGTFLLVKASKQVVVGWGVIGQSTVPEKAMDKIKSSE